MDKSFVQNRMLEYAKNSGRSLSEISKKMGHRSNYISGAVSGHFEPKLEEVLYFCEILGVNPSDFFQEEPLSLEQQQVCQKIRRISKGQLKIIQSLLDEFLKTDRK
ncbi:MAG: helix-turn-helix transcriptional regulator [Clostridia bacterium]|nr:helix-turn-helix transcriptional regulator [Clostridia bacterium]